MPARSWKFHLLRLVAVSAAVLMVGWLLGHPWSVLLLATIAYAVWHLANLWRMYQWLHNPSLPIPETTGIWAEIFDHLSSLEQQNRKQATGYRNMIAEFQNLTSAFPDATLVLDQSGNMTWCNDAAVRLLGFRVPDDLGQPLTNLVRDPAFAEWLSADDPGRLEMTSPVNDSQWLQVTSVPFQDEQRLVILRNITDLHSVEQIRRDFVANISHELRTPVTVLLGYLELLHGHPNREVNDAVERMQSQAAQMRALLDDLLELSRLQSDVIQGDEQDVDVSALLGQLKEQAEEISRGRHRIRFDADPHLMVRGVASDIESAFRNLIINAINYTPENGSITVRWEDSAEGPRFSVTDTGIGIPRRHLPRLTERFYRVSPDRARSSGGTGLGLAIVKHVLNAHRARLIIRSELGEGSEFTCVFPVDRRVIYQPELIGRQA